LYICIYYFILFTILRILMSLRQIMRSYCINQVVNGESAMNVTEKKFFRRVIASVAKPKNVFIQFNRWDCVDHQDDDDDEISAFAPQQQSTVRDSFGTSGYSSASHATSDNNNNDNKSQLMGSHVDSLSVSESMLGSYNATLAQRAKQQHMQYAQQFLVDELKCCSVSELPMRVFFVSAKEALLHRVTQSKFDSQYALERYKYSSTPFFLFQLDMHRYKHEQAFVNIIPIAYIRTS
jgi:hypothetical protein